MANDEKKNGLDDSKNATALESEFLSALFLKQQNELVQEISGCLYRLVESQEQVASMTYVDTLEEQVILEQLLEEKKPPYPKLFDDNKTNIGDYHYLLKTPFRYPPLKWGSRFGRTFEPSLFYGGLSIQTTLAESAYYRFVFWLSMQGTPIKKTLKSEHSLFSADYHTSLGLKLQQFPFIEQQAILRDRQDYKQTQLLGSSIRAAGIEAFEYISARDKLEETKLPLCIGLFSPAAFCQTQPKTIQSCFCELSANEVVFKLIGENDLWRFKLEDFLVNDEFPFPAS